jgi:heavy metal sensor kinase
VRIPQTSIRIRLTFWYVGIFSLILVAYTGGASFLHYQQLNDQLYRAEIQDLETVEGLLYFSADGQLLLQEDYHSRPQSRLLLDRMMEVLDDQHHVVFRNEKLKNMDLGGTPLPAEESAGYFARRLSLSDGTKVLCVSHLHGFRGHNLLIRVAYSTEPLTIRLYEFLGALFLVMPVAIVIAGLAGYRMAGKVLDPVEQMANLAQHITADRLSERLPVENPRDEFGHMAQVLNDLLERLEQSFTNLRRFTSDVSHELRTPLASMRSVGEVGLQRRREPAEYEDIIGSMLEEVAQLSSLVNSLLTIAQADSGSIELNRDELRLAELVAETIAIVSVLADERKQTIVATGDESITIAADRGFLRMALLNLLDNAVKFSPPESKIEISWNVVRQASEISRVELTVKDQGAGIPEEDREHVFDRFYRVDEGRNRRDGGVGLGLAITKWIVESHGGAIRIVSGNTGGSAFLMSLPLMTPDRSPT